MASFCRLAETGTFRSLWKLQGSHWTSAYWDFCLCQRRRFVSSVRKNQRKQKRIEGAQKRAKFPGLDWRASGRGIEISTETSWMDKWIVLTDSIASRIRWGIVVWSSERGAPPAEGLFSPEVSSRIIPLNSTRPLPLAGSRRFPISALSTGLHFFISYFYQSPAVDEFEIVRSGMGATAGVETLKRFSNPRPQSWVSTWRLVEQFCQIFVVCGFSAESYAAE